MLACWDCRNLNDFVQVSTRGDARRVKVSPRTAIETAGWEPADNRPSGVYCGTCGVSLGDLDLGEHGLTDERLRFVAPEDFRASEMAEELMALRPDAQWHQLVLQSRPARHAPIPEAVGDALRDALARNGQGALYSHQATAIAAALDGEHVIQATAAGSGKSLGFVVPVLEALSLNSNATALLTFPLRALANDQLHALGRLGERRDINDSMFELDLGHGTKPIIVGRYDGSSFQGHRTEIRRRARLVITTPDSLHASILRMAGVEYKDKTSWRRLLGGLKYVVLDEVHSYSGVFGSNVAQVLRRLRRAAAFYGANPQFLAASATIGNPIEHVERLTGVVPFRLVNDDGSPQRPRAVLVCNPPIASEQTVKKRQTTKGEATLDGEHRIAPQTIALDLLPDGMLASENHAPVRTICFARSRGEVFALTERIKERLRNRKRTDLVDTVAPYAATLLTDDRVDAEGRLRDGSTLVVVSTNALELGIDIPDLSISLLCGYPGQISSFRQRAGRCGRSGEGLVVLIVGDDPLQQHLARQPAALTNLLNGRAEDVVINPGARAIVERFGIAAAEADFGGLAFEDAKYFDEDLVERWLEGASGRPDVHSNEIDYWKVTDDKDAYDYPGIRSAGGQAPYVVVAVGGGAREAVGYVSAADGPRDAFVGAIYSGNQGKQYRVVGVAHKAREVYCEGPTSFGFVTRGVPIDRVEQRSALAHPVEIADATLAYSQLTVRRNVYSYKKLHFSGAEENEPVESAWPESAFDTEGLHLHLDPATLPSGDERSGAVRAVEHVLLSLAPVVVACDPFDIEGASDGNTIYMYDSFGEGIGMTRPVFERFGEIARLAYETVEACPCESGCPGCIVLSRRPDGNRNLSKAGALTVLSTFNVERARRET